MDQKIEVKVVNVANSQEQASAFAMVLQEVKGKRQMPVIIGSAEAQSIVLSLKGIQPPRPLTHDLFVTCMASFSISAEEVLIYKAKEGVFYSYVTFRKDDTRTRIDARTSDAIGIAIRSGCPIYVYESILEKEQLLIEDISDNFYTEESTNESTISLQGKSLTALKKELEKAISEENYELASLLRDEISRRK
ncbi:bifunctional nuclease family protein [Bacteroides sp. 224]|uniref:bifunctional nuclease family protein n=1 Tax=Bacteroides sp. 224 TaxID=2302936 RepID=UPI0013D5DC68|nr:bifunctional nuclease family protein [Bacteroides sp. 224]NDV65319.1 DNA helicase UvrB [Bacteroides sp. 224]